MKYILSLIAPVEGGPAAQSPEEMQELMEGWNAYNREIVDAGVFVAGDALQPGETATTVEFKDSDRLVTDGPFAETKEQLGGYYVLNCADLDEALEWAKKVPIRDGNSVEVRPCMDLTEFGYLAPYAEAAAS